MQTIQFAKTMKATDYHTTDAVDYRQTCKHGSGYEYIPDEIPVKLYFDIDVKLSVADINDTADDITEVSNFVKTDITTVLKHILGEHYIENLIFWGSSHGVLINEEKIKVSYHVVINNIIAYKWAQGIIVQELNRSVFTILDDVEYYPNGMFDESVYKPRNQIIRSPYTAKPNGTFEGERPIKIESGTFEMSCITAFIPKDAMIWEREKPVRATTSLGATSPSAEGSTVGCPINRAILEGIMPFLKPYAGQGQYKPWTTVIWGIKNITDDRNLGITFSRLDMTAFDETSFDNIWDNAEIRDNNGVGIGTLISLAMKTDKEGTKQVLRKIENAVQKDTIREQGLKQLQNAVNREPTIEDGKIVYYDFHIRKMFHINNLIESNGDETKFSDLIYELNENYLFLRDDTIYLYYEAEWRSMNKKDAGILKHLIKEIIEIYIKVALDIINEALKANLQNDDLLSKYKVKLSNIMSVNGLIKKNQYINSVFSLLKNRLCCKKMNFEFDVGPNNYYLIHFKNGVYDLKQKMFRSREITDYITMTLDYDYIPLNRIEQTVQDDVLDFFKKVQPDETQRTFTLSYLAYCLTANTSHQIFKMNIGYSGGNGKSTELSFHEKSFPLYTAKLDSRVFLKGFEKRHKHLIEMAKRPIRLAYCEELPSKALDNAFVKDFVDGNQLPVEVMFGTKVMVKIQAKLCSTSQFDPLFSSEGGINRRGIIQYYTSTFVEKDETDESIHEYKKDLHFLDKFNGADYKNAYFHLLLQYVEKLSVPQMNRDAFKEVVEEGDVLLGTINKYATIDKNDNSRVHIDEIKKVFHMVGYKELANKLKLMGCVYKKNIRIQGTQNMGVWCGIQINPENPINVIQDNEGVAEQK
jgi:hypothetical protein